MKLFFILLFSTGYFLIGSGQTAVFFQKVVDRVDIDSIVSVATAEGVGSAWVGVDSKGNQKLQFAQFGSVKTWANKLDLVVNYMYFQSPDSLIIVDRMNKSFYFEKSTNEVLPIAGAKDSPTLTSKQGLRDYAWYSTEGYLSQESTYYNPVEGVWYCMASDNLYRYASKVNSYLEYHHIDVDVLAYSREARRFDKDRWLVSLDHSNMLMMMTEDTIINVNDLPVNRYLYRENLIFYHFSILPNVTYLVANDYQIYVMDNLTLAITRISTQEKGVQFKNLVKDSKDRVWAGSKQGDIFEILPDGQLKSVIQSNESKYIDTYRFYEDKNGYHWWGFNNGMLVYLPDTGTYYGLDRIGNIAFKGNEISAFAHQGNRLLVGTYDLGLYSTDYNALMDELLSTDGGGQSLPNQVCEPLLGFTNDDIRDVQYLTVIDDEYVVVRTYERLWILDGEDYTMITPNMGYRSYMSNFFSDIEVSGGIVYSTEKGFCVFYPQKFIETNTASDVALQSFGSAKGLADYRYIKDKIFLGTITGDDAYVQLMLNSSVNYLYPRKWDYQYDDQDWQKMHLGDIILANSEVGSHSLRVRSAFDLDHTSPLEIRYTIKQVWSKTWWFRSLMVLALLSLGVFLYRILRSRQNLERNLKLLETESLRSYMNPHFISNSLNSINFYILQNDKEKASSYIIKFAKLIRKILKNSESEFVEISEELDTLKAYIEIEQLRFDNRFDYRINTDQTEEQDKIPSFVLQPIIENAIWHGLIQKVGHGMLDINIVKKSNGYLFEVLDNGVGYKKSAELQSKSATKRKSYGTKMINKRLQLLNELYNHNNTLEIHDRSEYDDSEGTVAKIFLQRIQ